MAGLRSPRRLTRAEAAGSAVPPVGGLARLLPGAPRRLPASSARQTFHGTNAEGGDHAMRAPPDEIVTSLSWPRRVKRRPVIRTLERDGWRLDRQVGKAEWWLSTSS